MFTFTIFRELEDKIFHAVLDRHTDIHDHVALGATLDIPLPIFFKEQLHGKQTHLVGPDRNSDELRGDILMTRVRNTPLGIRIADCGSILMYDPVTHAIANIHAGWRGLTLRVISHAIGNMARHFGTRPEDILVGISPMIGPCCSVFSDPYNELPRLMHAHITEENSVNLWAAVEAQLRECGVLASHMENPRLCTSCNIETYFSYRREGATASRFGTILMLK